MNLTITENRIDLDLTVSPIALTVTPSDVELTIDRGNVTYNIAGGGIVYNEVPNGTIDGSNATFTSNYDFIISTLQVFLNGVKLKQTNDYTTTGTNTIILVSSPTAGEILQLNYLKL